MGLNWLMLGQLVMLRLVPGVIKLFIELIMHRLMVTTRLRHRRYLHHRMHYQRQFHMP